MSELGLLHFKRAATPFLVNHSPASPNPTRPSVCARLSARHNRL